VDERARKAFLGKKRGAGETDANSCSSCYHIAARSRHKVNRSTFTEQGDETESHSFSQTDVAESGLPCRQTELVRFTAAYYRWTGIADGDRRYVRAGTICGI